VDLSEKSMAELMQLITEKQGGIVWKNAEQSKGRENSVKNEKRAKSSEKRAD
jgi:hypothetical protein